LASLFFAASSCCFAYLTRYSFSKASSSCSLELFAPPEEESCGCSDGGGGGGGGAVCVDPPEPADTAIAGLKVLSRG